MKVSETWLREWVNPSLTAEELAAQLTMAGLEVDAVTPVAGEFNHVVVAEVLKTEPHPQADKLTVCEINANDGKNYTVVCGASNVRPGLKVALAKLGATLPGSFKIKEVKLRGQLSQGMLCSSSELGFEENSEGILELPDDAPVGQDLRDYMSLNDHVLDIDLTPNRADCFSILGVAREVAALNGQQLKELPLAAVKPEIDDALTIKVDESRACPQYYGRIIRDINPQAETPLWLKERLRRGGIRPLHPVVDVTNYIMLELGQPMHAFDKQALNGDIIVRYAKSGETLILLDGQEVELSDKVLVIADQVKPLAIAGIMGGEESAVQAGTTDLFLESAHFNPLNIAGVARKYGLCSDSSQRFERGVDPELQEVALIRATQLLQQIVGGKAGPVSRFFDGEHLPKVKTVPFRPARVQQLSGVVLKEAEMEAILQHLGMHVNRKTNVWQVEVPTHRFDIAIEEDLIEEVIRVNGYENIQAQPMITNATAGTVNPHAQLMANVVEFMGARGYHETISYSFVDPDVQEVIYPQSNALRLLNPISQELSEMRAGMWPGLIASMIYNLHRQQTAIKLFEAGVAFDVNQEGLEEKPYIAGLMVGEHGALNWTMPTRAFDFYDLKGDLDSLLDHLKIADVQYISDAHPALHPGKSARIKIGKSYAGWIGVLHPKITDELDLTGEVVLFELAVNELIIQNHPQYQPISKYPQIRRDLSLLVDADINIAAIEQTVRSIVNAEWLKTFDVFDVYTGNTIPEGKKSIAIALTLQDATRTLVDTEINAAIDAIIISLKDKFAITLRD